MHARCYVGLLWAAAKLVQRTVADVYWNPGDNINRHNAEFAEVQRVAASWTPPVVIHRVGCPPRLEDEILYVRDRYANPAVNLSLPSNRLDIFRVESSWLRSFTPGSLLDLAPVVGPDLSRFDQRPVNALTVDGQLLAVPSFLDTTLLYYRSDLLAKYGLAVPETWDQLEAAARTIQNGERAAGVADFWGLQWQGAANEILTFLSYEFIGSHGGGTFVNASGGVDIVNAAAMQALERVRQWILGDREEPITPSAIINQHLHETKLPFLYERAAFLLDLTHIIGEIHSYRPDGCDVFLCGQRNFADRVSYTQLPGLSPSTRGASPWFWGWAVNKRSPAMDEVVRVVKYLASREQQLFKARNGDPPTLVELQQDSAASETCGSAPQPNICTLPLSRVTLLDRNTGWLRQRYFKLPDTAGNLVEGLSPIIFTNFHNFLLNPNSTAHELVNLWACKAGAIVHGTPSLCPPCPPGSQRADDLTTCNACPLGEYGLGAFQRCLACPPGRYTMSPGSAECVPCLANTVAPNAGSEVCTPCSAGYHTDLQGQTACEACPAGTAWDSVTLNCTACAPGTVSVVPGGLQCQPCGAGTFAAAAGRAECAFCPAGSFQAALGSTACVACEAVLTGSTSEVGSLAATACICPLGTFSRPGRGCVPCPDGLRCPAGRGLPKQLEGFFGVIADPDSLEMQVFRCHAHACPDGELGTCAQNREGFACDNCVLGSTTQSDGACVPCGTDGRVGLQVALVAIAIAVIVSGVSWFLLRGNHFIAGAKRDLYGILGVSITALQCHAAFAGLDIPWVSPLSALQRLLQSFQLDADLLKPSCVAGITTAPRRYLFSVLAVPVLLLYLALLNGCLYPCKRHVSWPRLCNCIGCVLWAVFLSLVVLVSVPFQCTDNPSGTPTVTKYRSVRCWSGDRDHAAMVGLGLALLIIPTAFLTAVVYGTIQYPRLSVQDGGIQFMEKFDFILARLRAEQYYFGLVLLARSTLLGFAPIYTRDPDKQIMAMGAVLSTYAVLQAFAKPWRSHISNILDAAFSVVLLMVCLSGAVLVGKTRANAQHTVEVTLWIGMVTGAIGAVGLLCMYLKTLIWPAKMYAVFLSHHKGGAAVRARFFKEVLSQQLKGNIFLDCDELDELDNLHDFVAKNTRTVLVLLTKDYFRRMWCAVEIVTSLRNAVPTLLVACDSHELPTDDFLTQELPNVWTTQQWAELHRQGVLLEDVAAAYKAVSQMPAIAFPATGSYHEQMSAITAVGEATGLARRMLFIAGSATSTGSRSTPAPLTSKGAEGVAQLSATSSVTSSIDLESGQQGAEIVVTGRTDEPEPLCTCYLLQRYLQLALRKQTATFRTPDEVAAARKSNFFVVVLTPGILTSEGIAQSLRVAVELHMELVPVLASSAFSFPTQDFYAGVLNGTVLQGTPETSRELVVDLFKALFNILVLDFSPHASKSVLEVEVARMEKRFLHRDSVGRRSSPTSSEAVQLSTGELVVPGELGQVRRSRRLSAEWPKAPDKSVAVEVVGQQPIRQQQLRSI